MKTLILITLLISVLALPAFAYEWVTNPANGHRYGVVQVPLENRSWNALEALAASLGGHLVSMSDANENEWVLQNVINPFAYSTEVVEAWAMAIGFYQLPNSSEPGHGWVWTSGETAAYMNWFPLEPNNLNGASVAVITSGRYTDYWGVQAGKWDDQLENAPNYGIVEVAPVPEPSSLLALAGGLVSLGILKRRR